MRSNRGKWMCMKTIEVRVHGHLGWPAGLEYRVVALTAPDAVR